MPYIAIKGFPKDNETIRKVAARINETLLELWGCPQAAINISYEPIPPEEWDERMEHGEIAQNRDRMLILGGKWMNEEKKPTDDCYIPTGYAGGQQLCEVHLGDG